jgi:redox-sensitive bicupin YhaK (pirin superfamily)
MVFLLSGDAKVAGETISEKTAVKLTNGNSLDIESLQEDIQILFISSDKLEEPVYWGGPIVMNSKEELDLAFRELRKWKLFKGKS